MSRKMAKAYPQLAALSNYHLELAAKIEKLRPSLLGYAYVGEWENEQYLQIDIPSPLDGRKVYLYTARHRLTFGFDRGHGHAYFDDGFESALKYALEFIDLVINEELIFAMLVKPIIKGSGRGQERISYCLYLREKLEEIPKEFLAYTRSYNGTYDYVYRELRDPLYPD